MSVYATAGVDIDAGTKLSIIAMRHAQRTWNANPGYAGVAVLGGSHFRTTRILQLNRKNPLVDENAHLSPSNDGIGTKVLLDSSAGTYYGTAANLIAMTADDVTAKGALPIGFTNVLNINSSKFLHEIEELHRGLADVCQRERIIVVNGETAELGALIGGNRKGFIFEWSGTMEGLYREDRSITGEHVEVGDDVHALQELGPRSNGISAIRHALKQHYGPQWSQLRSAREHVLMAAMPSVVYSRLFADLNGWYDNDRVPVKHIAHLSGGGILDKFGADLLKPLGLSAELTDLFDIPEILRLCAQWTGMAESEMFRTWSVGQGALVTTSPKYSSVFLERAQELGFAAKKAGVITKRDEPRLSITSRLSGADLSFSL